MATNNEFMILMIDVGSVSALGLLSKEPDGCFWGFDD